MKRLTKIIAAAAALILTLGMAGCYSDKDSGNTGGTDASSYPDFINPTETEETSEKYKINVVSKGGLKLDGVRVTAKTKDGVAVKTGISSDGVIYFGVTLGEYTLEVDEDSLPDGYYLEEGITYTTNPDKREAVTIEISSKVISQAASSSKVYEIGDIVNDFAFRTYGDNSKTYKLSTLLSTKKAVVLNFWYPDCSNCTLEFPFLNSVYNSSVADDVEVLAVCSSSLGYTESDIADYNDDMKLVFPLGMDTANLHTHFSVSAWPTTVVIDRYGMYAYRSAGAEPTLSYWQSLFTKYTSDDYVQSVDGSSSDDNGSTSTEKEYPSATAPTNEEMAQAVSTGGINAMYSFPDAADEPYSWPWVVANDDTKGSVLAVSNTGKQSSYASLYVNVEMKKNQVLSFDYYVDSEEDYDILYVLLDGQIANEDKTVELAFIYKKDSGDSDTTIEDVAKIDNLSVREASADMDALDVMREAAYGETSGGKYESYITPVKGTDGFYHVDSSDGPLLYISINNITQWSALHTENNQFTSGDNTMYATLYLMTYYKYYNSANDNYTTYIGDTDFEDVMEQYYHLLDALEAPYYLIPVNDSLKAWVQAFVTDYEKTEGSAVHENEWLEFCYYYDHYGKTHTDGEACKKTDDITEGLTIYNPIEVSFISTPVDGESTGKILGTVEYPLSRPNSVYYEFTAPKTGVYQVRDYKQPTDAKTSTLYVYTLSENGLSMVSVASCEDVSDFDQYTDSSADYYSFNAYLELTAGVTYYFEFMIEEQQTGNFTFDITYHDSVVKLFDCTTGGGAWTYMQDESGTYVYLWLGITYKKGTDGKYYKAVNGEPDYNQKIYINMVYDSYYSDGTHNSYSVEELMDTDLVTDEQRATLKSYLEKAKAKDPTDEYYGLVEADDTIVSILAQIVAAGDTDAHGGAGNGWLAFAVYEAHIG